MSAAIPSPLYVAFQGLETYFVDKDTGNPLAAGYVEFYIDTERSTPKVVFQQSQLPDETYEFVNIGNVVNLTSVGTFESPADGTDIQVYAYPYDEDGNEELYFLKVFSSDGVLQFTREAQPANAFAGNSNLEGVEPTANQITNPQFSEILFTEDPTTNSYVLSVSSNTEVEIAPGWTLVISASGSGTVTLSQVSIDDTIAPSNPPYALQITSSGSISAISLRQRFEASPRLFANGFVNGYLLAADMGNAESNIRMLYVPSNGDSHIIIDGDTSASSTLTELQGTVEINGTINTDTAPDGYVDIIIQIPTLRTIRLTSIQVVLVPNEGSTIEYLQQSSEQQENQLFYFYKDQLIEKPIPYYSIGWDFPLNPCQALGPTVAATSLGANKSRYIADQTIAFEATDNALSYAFSSSTGLTVSTSSASQWALVQYLEAGVAKELLSGRMAVKLYGYTTGAALNGYVNIYYTTGATLPNVASGTNNSLIATMTDGQPASFNLAGGVTWTQVSRSNLGNAVFQLSNDASDAREFHFNGWDATATVNLSTATYVAIVISFASMPSTTTATIKYCTLCQGDIATNPCAMNQAQILDALQYYYEKSYDSDVIPGSNTAAGGERGYRNAAMSYVVTGVTTWLAANFGIEYNTVKRKASTVTLYNPTSGTSNQVLAYVYNGASLTTGTAASSFWAVSSTGTKAIVFQINSAAGGTASGSASQPTTVIQYQYVADARLGIVL